MNDRLHDKIQQLANGELSASEASALRAQISGNREALALVAQYEALRADMGLLQQVPDSQLSKERLRERLLTQGLKPAKSSPVFGWLWMPTAAFALAVLFYMNTNGRKSMGVPEVLVPTESSRMLGTKAPLPDIRSNPSALSAPTIPPTMSQPAASHVTTVATLERPRQRRHHREAAPLITEAVETKHVTTAAILGNPAQPPAAAFGGSTRDSIGEPTTVAFNSSSDQGESVVMISNSADIDTGAQQATEEATTNVIVGG